MMLFEDVHNARQHATTLMPSTGNQLVFNSQQTMTTQLLPEQQIDTPYTMLSILPYSDTKKKAHFALNPFKKVFLPL
jgi:hypothetical protein